MHSERKRVFVYGTLRRGHANHAFIKNGRYMGTAETKEKYALYVDRLPYLVKEPVSHIIGELYEVDDETLRQIDWLEGHPTFYRRDLCEVIAQDGTQASAYIYFYPYPTGELLKTGDFADYTE